MTWVEVVFAGFVDHSDVTNPGCVVVTQNPVTLADLEILGPRFSTQMAYPLSRLDMAQSKNPRELADRRPGRNGLGVGDRPDDLDDVVHLASSVERSRQIVGVCCSAKRWSASPRSGGCAS